MMMALQVQKRDAAEIPSYWRRDGNSLHDATSGEPYGPLRWDSGHSKRRT
jgi:hypothetical protein